MIFVTVGNATQRFHRLLDAIDQLACQGWFKDEEVIVQAGNYPGFRSSCCKWQPFFLMESFLEMVQRADLVICHAGAGILLHAIRTGKVPVAMPRRRCYGEHVDDHQVELVHVLAEKGKVVPAYEPQNLPDAIVEARRRNASPDSLPMSSMVGLVAESIEQLLERRV